MRTKTAPEKIPVHLSSHEWARLYAHPSFPSKEKGKTKWHDFYHAVFMEGLNSPRYKIEELEHQLKQAELRAKSAQSNSDFWMKRAKAVK